MIKAIPQQVLEDNRRKLKSGFKLFKLAYQSKWKKSAKNEEFERKLSRMWNHVSTFFMIHPSPELLPVLGPLER